MFSDRVGAVRHLEAAYKHGRCRVDQAPKKYELSVPLSMICPDCLDEQFSSWSHFQHQICSIHLPQPPPDLASFSHEDTPASASDLAHRFWQRITARRGALTGEQSGQSWAPQQAQRGRRGGRTGWGGLASPEIGRLSGRALKVLAKAVAQAHQRLRALEAAVFICAVIPTEGKLATRLLETRKRYAYVCSSEGRGHGRGPPHPYLWQTLLVV